MNYKKLLQEFHKALFIKVGDYKQDINQHFLAGNPTADLRVNLIKEEANELCEALKEGTREEVRKELCDYLYVGFAVAAVYDLPVDDDFKIVHSNNLLKIKNAITGPNGKLLKAPNHPKVVFEPQQLDLFDREDVAKVLA